MRIRLTLLGGFAARLDDGPPLVFARKKAQALLAYLALQPRRTHPRDEVAALLWADSTPESARNSLRQTLHAIRQALPPELPSPLLADGHTIGLDVAAVTSDVAEFERLATAGVVDALGEAVELYRGDLLAGLTEQPPAFEEWLLAERARLHELALEALARLLAHQMERDLVEPAIRTAVRLLGLDPLQEVVHRTLMRLYVGQGRRAAALRQYQVCVAALQRELGAEPEAETSQLYRDILAESASPAGPPLTPDEIGFPLELAVPLIGRSGELGRLRDALERAWRAGGQVAVITGEAGVGKSRLVAELAVEAGAQGGTVLVGRAYEGEHVLPFGPWVNALRAGEALRGEASAALDEPRRVELARLFPELGTPARHAVPTAEDRVRLFEALLHLIGALASRRRLLVILEDLHWADEMSVRLLAFVGRRAPARTLVVGTVRDEVLADAPMLRTVLHELDRERALVDLPLSALSRAGTLALVRALARSGTDGAELARLGAHVWSVSEGNPFVAVEAMRVLEGATDAKEPLPATLPPRVRDLVAWQLERVSAPGRDLAAAAAVIGREFDFALLRIASDMSAAGAAEGVEELVRRRILHGVGEHFDFTHDRIRSGVYAALLPPRRRALHAAVGAALEALYANDLEPRHAALALHYREAEAWGKAVEYRARLAGTATRVHAHAEATAALGEALELVARLPEAERDRRRGELVLRLARSLTVQGRLGEVLAVLGRDADTVARLDDPALGGRYHFLLGNAHGLLGDGDAALASARRSLDAARRAGDTLTQGRAHYVLALEGFWSGRLRDGVAHAREAVRLCSASGEPGWVGLAHWTMAFNFILMGEFSSALEAAALVRAIADEVHDDRLRREAAWLRGGTLAFMGECDAAIAECEESLEGAPHPLDTALRRAWLGYAHLENGDAERAIGLLEDAVGRFGRFRFRAEGWFTAWLGEAHLLARRIDTADTLATHGLAVARAARQGFGIAIALRATARVALARGERDRAARHLHEALAAFEAMHARFETGRTRLDLADLARAARDADGVSAHAGAALDVFRTLAVPRWLERAERFRARTGR